MDIHELKDWLKEKGFNEEKQDTGIKYTLSEQNIELICYIEPNIEIEFISLYKWHRNDVKGIHNISIGDFSRTKDSILTLWKKTKNNMPEHIGEEINTHEEVDKVIESLS